MNDNVTQVRRFVEDVWNGADGTGADLLLADDFISHGPGPFEFDRRGLAYFVQFLEDMRHATDRTGAVSIEAIVGEGETVMVWVSDEHQIPVERLMSPELLEMVRQNQSIRGIGIQEQVKVMGVGVFRVVHGKIAELWVFTSYPLTPPSS